MTKQDYEKELTYLQEQYAKALDKQDNEWHIWFAKMNNLANTYIKQLEEENEKLRLNTD